MYSIERLGATNLFETMEFSLYLIKLKDCWGKTKGLERHPLPMPEVIKSPRIP